MKQSEEITEWIKNKPTDWEIKKIKHISKIYGRIGFRGYTVNDIVNEGEGAITISPSNIDDQKFILRKKQYLSWEKYEESPEIKIFNNDLLLVKTASVGKVAFVEGLTEKATINPQLVVFKDIKVNRKYLYYCLVSNVIQIQVSQDTYGGVVNTLTQSSINNYKVLIPSYETQDKIVELLDKKTSEIDSLITDKQKLIDLLEEKRQATITEAVTKGLNPDVKMKDSGVEWIGGIPDHWEVWKMKYKFQIKKVIEPTVNPTVLSLTQRGIKVKDLKDFSGQHAENYDKYQKVNIGDFVMNSMDLLTGFVDCSKIEGVTSPDYRVFRMIGVSDSREYYLKYFQICYWNKIFYGHGQGVSNFGRWRLQADVFKEFPIPVPPVDEQKAISEYIEEKVVTINELVDNIKVNIKKLKEYRQALIYEAVTGKVDVRDYNKVLS